MGFKGRTILSFESRRAEQMENMIKRFNGRPIVAPTLKEVPLTEHPHISQFVEDLLANKINGIIFTTGVGTQQLFKVISEKYSLQNIIQEISLLYVVARGPKPVKVLREHKVDIDVIVPEPNTWQEILVCFDENKDGFDLSNKRVAIQEYGVANIELIDGLKVRGAQVQQVFVYRWELPDDIDPIKRAIDAVILNKVDMVLLTSAVQIRHVLKVAEFDQREEDFRSALNKIVLCSVGPVCSKTLTELGFRVDFMPSHPKQGHLVKESAENADELCK